jgi:uncharacterized protein (TIGR02246 family)
MRFADHAAEIASLEGEYARAWDAADSEGWAAVFTEDGVFEVPGVGGRPLQRFDGRAALRELCERYNAKYEGLHLMHVPRLAVNGDDDATARLHFEFAASSRPGITPSVRLQNNGYYDVNYRRVDGRWLMALRVETTVSETISRFFGIQRDRTTLTSRRVV